MKSDKQEKNTKECYVSTKDISFLFGISQERVRQLIKAKVIDADVVKGDYQLELYSTVGKYAKYLESICKKLPVDLETRKLLADVEIRETKAAIEKVRLIDTESKLLPADDVRDMTSDLIMTIREKCLSLCDNDDMINLLAKEENPSKCSIIIRDEIYKILNELSEYEYTGNWENDSLSAYEAMWYDYFIKVAVPLGYSALIT